MTLVVVPACTGDDGGGGETDTDGGTDGTDSSSATDSNSSSSGATASGSATSGGSGSASGGSSGATTGSGSASASGSTSESTTGGTSGSTTDSTSGGTGGVDCGKLAEKACGEEEACTGIFGKPLMGGGGVGTIPCWDEAKFFGCMAADTGCGDAETVACLEDKNPTLFPDTCIPADWVTCDPPGNNVTDCP